MAAHILLFIQLVVALTSASGSLNSQFLKTKIFQEVEQCQLKVSTHGFISDEKSPTLIECGKMCADVGNCRRFMFDFKNRMCSLFHSGENCFTHLDVEDKICFRLTSRCDEVNCTRCPIGYYGDKCQYVISDCTDGYERNVCPRSEELMLSFMKPLASATVFEAQCVFEWGGWTVIQTRNMDCGEIRFDRKWVEYATGFGHRHGNHWLGLENLHNILQNRKFNLNILLGNYGTGPSKSYYDVFNISSAGDNYRITIDSYRGHKSKPTGDSLTNGTYNINGRPFSTYDQDYSNHGCADSFGGGWWYLDDPVCSRADFNGRRRKGDLPPNAWLDNQGIRYDYSGIRLMLGI